MRRVVGVLACLALAACSGGSSPGSTDEALVVVSAPLTAQPWIGTFLERGAQLAAQEVAG